jgi:hypothetical protein
MAHGRRLAQTYFLDDKHLARRLRTLAPTVTPSIIRALSPGVSVAKMVQFLDSEFLSHEAFRKIMPLSSCRILIWMVYAQIRTLPGDVCFLTPPPALPTSAAILIDHESNAPCPD